MDEEPEDEFEMMRRLIQRLFRQLSLSQLDSLRSEPFVYGFSLRATPDGKPLISDFGNTRYLTERRGLEERQPLTDVIEGSDEIFVTMELPGASEEDVEIEAKGSVLVVLVAGRRKYFAEIDLPTAVLENDVKWTLRNGVLDVVLKKEAVKDLEV
ncbi:MAG: Hsp20/alpha crystallin family protein [Thermoplasmata archaeon]